MKSYYANRNAQSNGDHEVHESQCGHLPLPENRLYLGVHASCKDAVKKAKETYAKVNGCYYCCNECHTG